MKLRHLFFVVALLTAELLYAQNDFRAGFVVTHSGDTLYGQVDYRGDLLMGSTCNFKDANGLVSTYHPGDILGFRFVDGKYYVSKEVDTKKYFLEFLIKGKINVYYLRDANGDHYYLEKEYIPLKEIPYEEGVKYVDDKKMFYRSQKHVGMLKYYMQDAPGMDSRIQSVKAPEHHSLIRLAEDYHNVVCQGEDCIVYEKRAPLIKVYPELIGGVIKYSNVDQLDAKYYLHVGVIGHIWMPRVNEKVFFRTGVLFSRLDIDGKQRSYYKIPCHLEYIHSRGFFRPRFGYGLNFYRPVDSSVSFNFGGNIKLSESLFLSVTSDLEFESTALVVPHNLFSHSVMVGLFFNMK